MDIMEVSEKQRLSREDVAARLRTLADMLARHNDVEFDRGGLHFKVSVPDEVDFKVEIEIGDDEREIEIELTGDAVRSTEAVAGLERGIDVIAERERDPSGCTGRLGRRPYGCQRLEAGDDLVWLAPASRARATAC